MERDGLLEPSAELLASLRKLDDENLRKAYSEGTALLRSELARLNTTSKLYSEGAVLNEAGQLVAHPTPMLPLDFYQAAAMCIAGLDKLATMRQRSLKSKDDMFAEASDEELNRNLLRAMGQLLEEMPSEEIEAVLRRRRNFEAAEAGESRWSRRVDETPPLQLAEPTTEET